MLATRERYLLNDTIVDIEETALSVGGVICFKRRGRTSFTVAFVTFEPGIILYVKEYGSITVPEVRLSII